MTISAQPRKAGPYAGNGVAASFAFTFKVFAAADVRVLRTDGQGLEVLLLLGADYSVILNPDQNAAPGGQVALPVPLPVGEKVTIIGSLPIEQPLVLTNNGGFYPAVVNAALDRQAIHAQQNAEQLARALKFQASDDAAGVGELPQKAQRAGRVLAFDANTGKPVAGPLVDDVDGGGRSGDMAAATYDPQGINNDVFDRENHTGTQAMSTIGDKQGKVLDDLTPLLVEDLDSAVVPKGYLVSDEGEFLDGAQLFVQQTPEGLVTQTIHVPILGKSAFRTKPVGGAWSDLAFTIAPFDIVAWHGNTTTAAPNAVINSNGTFSRSTASYNPNPLLVVSGASHAFVKADVNKYARYTAAGAKTATFDSSEGFTAGDAFHITNRAASGNITISGTGVTLNAPKGGTLVLEPKDTVTVKFISPTEADVMGSTGAA